MKKTKLSMGGGFNLVMWVQKALFRYHCMRIQQESAINPAPVFSGLSGSCLFLGKQILFSSKNKPKQAKA